MQGTGNDFIVIDPQASPSKKGHGTKKRDWAKTAVAMCDRHYGIGADGVLLLLPSKSADFRMRIYNSDGSEAEMCGNGLRCLVKYFCAKKKGSTKTGELTVETKAGIRKARLVQNGGSTEVRLSMGKPRFKDNEIPVRLDGCDARITRKPLTVCTLTVDRRELPLSLVSMGNPHVVYFSESPLQNFPLTSIGPKIERHKIFPEGANFEIVHVKNRGEIDARVWERGAGITLACGTGACAVAVAARLNGLVDDRVTVNLPGGPLQIEWQGKGEVFLTGPAEFVFDGEWQETN